MNPEAIETWAEGVITEWRNRQISLEPGISLECILEMEKLIQFKFPVSFKVLYQKVNGFTDDGGDENFLAVWTIGRIREEFGAYPNFIGFSDFLINSHVYGFLKAQTGIYKNYDLRPRISPQRIADSFDEAIALINSNSTLLY